MTDGGKGPASKLLDQVIQADKEARSSSPTFLRNHSLTRGMEGGMEGFKLRSKLLKTKLTKTEVETLITELNKIKIIGVEDLANLDSHSLLSLNVKPRVRTILWQCAKKHCETFRLKDLFVESNTFWQRGTDTQSANAACERVASCLHTELGLRRWKDFSLISKDDLHQLADVSAEEADQISELVTFSREANWGSLKRQFEQVQQSMEIAMKNYAELMRNLSLFQNFVTVGVPLDASLNELANLKTKLLDRRDEFIRDLNGMRTAAGESIEEDTATHNARPRTCVIPSGVPWKTESKAESTSFRQQMRTLALNSSHARLFRKSFVDPNLNYISFIGEKKVTTVEDGSSGLPGEVLGEVTGTETVVVSFEKKKNSSQGDSSLMLLQSATGDELMKHSAVGKAKEMLDVLVKTPAMADFELSRVKDPTGEFTKSLLAMEAKLSQPNYKVGVLYVKPGQTKEDEIISNSEGSRAYDEFLKLLGDRITLKGWKQFTAGLDTRDNRNGAHSIFATIDHVSVMFHVATMMPFENNNEDQKLERKRHIGNDVVCIVFLDEGCSAFNPSTIRTEFIHVYIIVSPITIDNKLFFRVEVAAKDGVAKFGPSIPNCLFPNSRAFGQFLLTKIVNADIAASSAPVFKKRIMRARGALLYDLATEAKASKWLKKGAATAASGLVRDPSTSNIKSVGSGTKTVRARGLVKLDESSSEEKEKDKAEKRSLTVPSTLTSSSKEKDKEKDKGEKSPRG